ncbi:MAG: polyprenyl synthetase family protein [Pseudomonadales bacterium]|nr:polyprenyl synthetase family protein [Pseudomonadales bacterium]MDG1441199.1 polyprenyl synthetase family protein [Pseudomonadales bacterium]
MKLPFLSVVENDFDAVNQLILGSLSSHVPLVEEISNYLIEAGGKRLRPILVLLSAKACDYQQDQHISLAAIIEFLHTAMLLHDDVVDASDLRRGRKTVNSAWGNPASVLVGDFLHSRAFEMMVEIGDMKVMQILSHATNTIAEGEVQQLTNIRNPRVTEADYLEVISRKTAMLFEAASHSGAVLAHGTLEQQTALQAYGLHLGRAFQLVDDVLDYKGAADDMGKNIGDDLAEGKATLPLIVAMRDGEPDQADFVRQAILNGGVENLDRIAQIVDAAGGLKYTSELAAKETQAAIDSLALLPDSPYKKAMLDLADFSISRNH